MFASVSAGTSGEFPATSSVAPLKWIRVRPEPSLCWMYSAGRVPSSSTSATVPGDPADAAVTLSSEQPTNAGSAAVARTARAMERMDMRRMQSVMTNR